MSIFGKIMSAIFGDKAEAAPAPAPDATSTAPAAPASPANTTTAQTVAPAASPASKPAAATLAPKPKAMAAVDVAKVLDKLTDESDEDDIDWRKSIVDLMKLLKIDSSLKARKALADELGYTGDKKDSATMNVWLHKQVMAKLAENGGVVPADLKD